MSRFKNDSILFCFSNDLQMKIWSIKFFTVKSCGTQTSSFFYPIFSKCLKLFCGRCLVPYRLWLLMCWSCSTFSTISSIFTVIDQPERGASLTLKFPDWKCLNQLCATYWYCIMSINITNSFSSLSRILPFFVIKFQNISNFFFIFTHFQDAITFDWINKYHNFFLKLFYDMSFFKRTQILLDSINITRVMQS